MTRASIVAVSATHGMPVQTIFIGALVLVAWLAPLPLYVASIAVFGLPHVIWEMGFLRSRYGARWPWRWWLALWAVLLLQAGARGAQWAGHFSAQATQVADLLVLLLTAVIVILAPRGAGVTVRIAGAAAALLLLWLLQHGEIVMTLLLLGLAHNVTPVALGWDMARADAAFRPLAWKISALFLLPVVMVLFALLLAVPFAYLLPVSLALTPGSPAGYSAMLDAQLPASWSGSIRPALLSAMVLSQCLHYFCVIRLLPEAESQRTGRPLMSGALRNGVFVLLAMMAAYYLIDFTGARQLYAVAAGVHAWLEWPLLLMALLSSPASLHRA